MTDAALPDDLTRLILRKPQRAMGSPTAVDAWCDDAAVTIRVLGRQVATQSAAADMIAEERDAWEKRAKALEDDNAALREQVAAADGALLRKGYRKSCDIPACNCGDRWNHGGHAEQRLSEFADALRDTDVETNGVTLLKALQTLIDRAESAEADNAALRQLLTDMKPYWDGATRGSFSRELVALHERVDAAIAEDKP